MSGVEPERREGATGGPRRPLRVGLLLDSLEPAGWVADIVDELRQAPFVEIVVAVLREAPPAPAAPRESKWVRRYRNRDALLYTLFERWERRRLRGRANPFEPRSIEAAIAPAAVLRVTPRTTKHCDYLEDADVAAIRAHDLDVAVRFGFRILKGDVLRIARHGVWSYHHGCDVEHRGGPSGTWEVLEGKPTTGYMLQVLTEELDNGRVLARGTTTTQRNSVALNRANIHLASRPLLLRHLRRLYEEGPDSLGAEEQPAGWMAYAAPLYTAPRTREIAPFIWRRGLRVAGARLRQRREHEQWALAYHFHDVDAGGPDAPHQTLYRLKRIVPPQDRFWADPFPVRHEGRSYVLFEEMTYATNRGHISVLELDRKGPKGDPVPVLERPYHLSYPFAFEWRGEQWMLPESSANGTVELYRARRFPFEWELEQVLLDGVQLLDATLVEHGGRWWMFASPLAPYESYGDELVLYHAPSPLGPWTPHRRNPVVTDVRRARPAGRPFWWRGALHRPAQDSGSMYGRAIVVHRVDRLDECEYRETPVTRLEPNWAPDLLRMHTINAAQGLTVADLMLRRRR